jgi:hypothetical protein
MNSGRNEIYSKQQYQMQASASASSRCHNEHDGRIREALPDEFRSDEAGRADDDELHSVYCSKEV